MSRLEAIEQAFDKTTSEGGSFNGLGWPEHIGWLIVEIKRLKEENEKLKKELYLIEKDRRKIATGYR